MSSGQVKCWETTISKKHNLKKQTSWWRIIENNIAIVHVVILLVPGTAHDNTAGASAADKERSERALDCLARWSAGSRQARALPSVPSPRLSFLNPGLIYSLATGQLTSFARFMLLILWMMLGDEFMGVNMIFRWAPSLSRSVFDLLWQSRQRIGRRPSLRSLAVVRLQQLSCSTQKIQVVTGYLCIPVYF